MKPNFTDERGTITDLIVTPDYSVTHITFNKDAVRGNHYHQETVQYDFVLKGKLYAVQNAKETIINKGDSLFHDKNVRHAYRALEDSEIISICFGTRKGTDYEKDVYRLEGKDKLI